MKTAADPAPIPTLLRRWLAGIWIAALASCAPAYHPLTDPDLHSTGVAPAGRGVRVTYLGNTTLLISDGTTRLMVDGFLTRPDTIRMFSGRLAPDPDVIRGELDKAGSRRLNAVLVGHSHHDHALDAPFVARETHAVAVGSASYRFIHEGGGGLMDREHLITFPKQGCTPRRETVGFGEFKITFVPSAHVSSHNLPQRLIEGDITRPVKPPAWFHEYKCGDVYAIHISHPDGSIAVTTTAGAREGQFDGLSADVVFLGIGFIDKEPEKDQERYWSETVGTLKPAIIVPVHWDDFTKPLSAGLQPAPKVAFSVRRAMDWVKAKDHGKRVRTMGLRDSILLRGGRLR